MSLRFVPIVFLSLLLAAPAGTAAAGPRASRSARTEVKTQARARTATRAARRQGPKTRATAAERGSRLSRVLRATRKLNPLAKRAIVRQRISDSKQLRAEGRIGEAARVMTRSTLRNDKGQFVKNGSKKMTIRERFAMWRESRRVKKTAIKLAKQRAKEGDAAGSADALQALATLESGGRLGVIGRWQKARAEKRVFKAAVKSSRKALREGDVQTAADMQALFSDLRGGTRAERRANAKLSRDAFKLARSYAKLGNPEATWQALQMSSELSEVSGKKFNEKKAENLLNRAFGRAARELITQARVDYKERNFDQAAAKLAEANGITRSMKVKLSGRTRRQQRLLTRRLGERVPLAEKAAAEARAEAAAMPSAPAQGGLEPAAEQAAPQPQRRRASKTSEQIVMTSRAR